LFPVRDCCFGCEPATQHQVQRKAAEFLSNRLATLV
jgi:hypothetical protein